MEFFLHITPLLAVCFYFASGALYIQYVIPGQKSRPQLARGFCFYGWVFHLLFLVFARVFSSEIGPEFRFVILSFPGTLSAITVVALGLFLLFEKRYRLTALGAFLAPLGMAFMLFSSVMFHISRTAKPLGGVNVLLVSHWISVVIALVLFVQAFAVGIAIIVEESQLKKRRFTLVQQKLPPLNFLDELHAKLLIGGFVFMFLGVLGGFLVIKQQGIPFSQSDPRLWWSFLTLLVYLVAIGARSVRGWRGKRAAWLAVFGFCLLMVSLFSANLSGGTFHVY